MCSISATWYNYKSCQVPSLKKGQRWRSRPPSFLLLIWLTPDCKIYFIIPQWSMLWSGSQILNCNCCFCDDYACICYLHQPVVFHGSEQPWNSWGTSSMQIYSKYGLQWQKNPTMNLNEMVKITLCWGSWFLLYSMSKYGVEKTKKLHFWAPLTKVGQGVGGGGIKQLQLTASKWFSKNIPKPHPIIHNWNIFAHRKLLSCSMAVPMENNMLLKEAKE